MITCDTMDTEASIQQTIELAQAGCEIVRITAPTVKDARNLEHIVKGLRERDCDVPIVADIHFKPEAAMEAAKWVDKVRINPGNYADSKKFVIRESTDEQYAAELARIRERFSPLVDLCKKREIAMRIGTNHGSLSDRIMNRYGDTPLGMVESALEFARIARDLDYHDFVFSMKASNPKIMIAAYRLLVARLNELGPDWNYPLHLGVTEAGEGEDARIKSAIGIGSLLADGIGDTVRVSLTEDSPHEIPVAKALIENIRETSNAQRSTPNVELSFDPYSYQRRATETIERAGIKLGGAELIRVVVRKASFNKIAHKIDRMGDYRPEIVYENAQIQEVDPRDENAIAKLNSERATRFVTVTDYVACPSCGRTLFNLQTTTAKIKAATLHLKGVKIAIMGCIVNGPGEMADADFGYVGGAPGKVNLYVGKTAVKFNIPEAEAVDRLKDLIREHGKWIEPAPQNAAAESVSAS